MKKQYARFIILVIVVLGGCIWIDDDGSPGINPDAEETIIYINRTGLFVDNMIDGEFVGTVGPDSTLYITSRYLDGQHEFYSVAQDGNLSWGPTVFTLYDGEVFRIYLEETGMTFSVDR
ncbi:hypothetical protein JW823_01520 [bacterium]|nr:hypothetical protein [candidate division CSSED10-310 bacterium]